MCSYCVIVFTYADCLFSDAVDYMIVTHEFARKANVVGIRDMGDIFSMALGLLTFQIQTLIL